MQNKKIDLTDKFNFNKTTGLLAEHRITEDFTMPIIFGKMSDSTSDSDFNYNSRVCLLYFKTGVKVILRDLLKDQLVQESNRKKIIKDIENDPKLSDDERGGLLYNEREKHNLERAKESAALETFQGWEIFFGKYYLYELENFKSSIFFFGDYINKQDSNSKDPNGICKYKNLAKIYNTGVNFYDKEITALFKKQHKVELDHSNFDKETIFELIKISSFDQKDFSDYFKKILKENGPSALIKELKQIGMINEQTDELLKLMNKNSHLVEAEINATRDIVHLDTSNHRNRLFDAINTLGDDQFNIESKYKGFINKFNDNFAELLESFLNNLVEYKLIGINEKADMQDQLVAELDFTKEDKANIFAYLKSEKILNDNDINNLEKNFKKQIEKQQFDFARTIIENKIGKKIYTDNPKNMNKLISDFLSDYRDSALIHDLKSRGILTEKEIVSINNQILQKKGTEKIYYINDILKYLLTDITTFELSTKRYIHHFSAFMYNRFINHFVYTLDYLNSKNLNIIMLEINKLLKNNPAESSPLLFEFLSLLYKKYFGAEEAPKDPQDIDDPTEKTAVTPIASSTAGKNRKWAHPKKVETVASTANSFK